MTFSLIFKDAKEKGVDEILAKENYSKLYFLNLLKIGKNMANQGRVKY
jgi:hypothetical protein